MSASQLAKGKEPHHPLWRSLPNIILTRIIRLLISEPSESYIPLICSHVCWHWRRAVVNAPFLWTVIDVSRGLKLTELWFTRSADARLDVHFSEWGFHCGSPPTTPTTQSAVSYVQKHLTRCKSLDLGFYCICRTYDAMSFLWQLPETLRLDSLTIGPMGRTSFMFDDSMNNYDAALLLFRKINVIPTILRIDSYPICAESGVFSTHLTRLEVFAGAWPTERPKELPNNPAWRAVFLASPNLTSVKLWHPGWCNLIQVPEPRDLQGTVELLFLEELELTGPFVDLSHLFCESDLSKLRSLRVNSSIFTRSAPCAISKIAKVAPNLKDLAVSSVSDDASEWEDMSNHLGSLRRITFVEMGWGTISEALKPLASLCQTRNLSHIQLQKIWDLEPYSWSQLNTVDGIAPAVSFVDCLDAPKNRYSHNEDDHYYVVSDDDSEFYVDGWLSPPDNDPDPSPSSENSSSQSSHESPGTDNTMQSDTRDEMGPLKESPD